MEAAGSCRACSETALEPAVDVVVAQGRLVATSREPWLRFRSAASFQAARFVEIAYRSSLYDDPVRPVLKFVTSEGETERILPGPVCGAGIWRGAVPKGVRGALISPCARAGRFDFRIESIRRLSLLEMAALVWRRRPKKLWSILLAATFGYFAEAENAMDWAIGAEPLDNFPAWRALRERELDLAGMDAPRSDWREGPSFLVVIDANGRSPDDLARTIASLDAQAYSRFGVLTTAPIEPSALVGRSRVALQTAAAGEDFRSRLAEASFIAFLEAGDELYPNAFAVMAEESARRPEAQLLYADELVGSGNKTLPLFKPDWSQKFEAIRPYLGRSVFVRAALADRFGPTPDCASFRDETHRAAARLQPSEIVHVRRLLLTAREAQSLASSRFSSEMEPAAPSKPPSVSIVLLTRDRADLLGPCLDSVLRLSTHPQFDLLIVDNRTRQATALAVLERASQDPRVRIILRPGPFNFAAFNNDCVRETSAEVLVFLNNDTEVLTPDWLERLSRRALEADVGAVGGMLLFPDGRIQHAGVVTGIGQDAGHFEALRSPSAPSWLERTSSLREVSAVTGACMAVERRKFEAAGGFDAENLPIEFNDIDLCLRLAEAGWRACYAPDVQLVHRESSTRGNATMRPLSRYASERSYFRRRWRHVIRDDPYFHPALSLYARYPALG